MQIAIVDDSAELSESCRPGQFSACLYGHLYGEHGWNGDAKFKKAIESFQFDCLISTLDELSLPLPMQAPE